MDTREPITSSETRGSRRYRGRTIPVIILTVLQAVHALIAAFSLDLPPALAVRQAELMGELASVSPIAIVVALVGLALAAGLWWMRSWAWFATLFWVGISMAGSLVAYLDREPAYPLMAMNVVMVLYLNQQEVRRIYHPARGEEAHT